MRLRSAVMGLSTSEMVLKSVQMKLRTEEVPIRFLKDRAGRQSHHKRVGWSSPWTAAWSNLRAVFVHGADFFLLRPGYVLVALGGALTFPLSFGPVTIGRIKFSLYFMLLGLTLSTLGLQCLYQGILAQTFFDYTGELTERWFSRFPYTRTVALAAGTFVVGLGLTSTLLEVDAYVRNGFILVEGAVVNHPRLHWAAADDGGLHDLHVARCSSTRPWSPCGDFARERQATSISGDDLRTRTGARTPTEAPLNPAQAYRRRLIRRICSPSARRRARCGSSSSVAALGCSPQTSCERDRTRRYVWASTSLCERPRSRATTGPWGALPRAGTPR